MSGLTTKRAGSGLMIVLVVGLPVYIVVAVNLVGMLERPNLWWNF